MYRKDGYVADTEYTHYFYKELSPTYIRFAALVSGYQAPDISKPFRYIELGSGQGLTTNILAATHPMGEFIGIDFNPSQIVKSRDMAERAGLANVSFRLESFQESAEANDEEIPPADFICLHGIYSWVSYEAREAIFKFISRKLRAGGIVYISYNTMPGWAELHPIRQFLYEYANLSVGSSNKRVEEAYIKINYMMNKDSFLNKNNSFNKSVRRMLEHPYNYISHEYFNDNWNIVYVTDMRRFFSDINLQPIGPAEPLESYNDLYMSEEALSILSEFEGHELYEFVKDLACNQWFRQDLFGYGTRRLSSPQRAEGYRNSDFTPILDYKEKNYQFNTYQGKTSLRKGDYESIVTKIHEKATFTPVLLEENFKLHLDKAVKLLSGLLASGNIHLETPVVGAEIAHKLNKIIIDRVSNGEPYQYIAAPKIGTAIPISGFDHEALNVLLYDPNGKYDGNNEYANQELSGKKQAWRRLGIIKK